MLTDSMSECLFDEQVVILSTFFFRNSEERTRLKALSRTSSKACLLGDISSKIVGDD